MKIEQSFDEIYNFLDNVEKAGGRIEFLIDFLTAYEIDDPEKAKAFIIDELKGIKGYLNDGTSRR